MRALRADPAHPGTLLGYAMLLTEIGQYQRAEVLLQRLWAQHEAEADDPIPPELLLTSAKLFAAAVRSPDRTPRTSVRREGANSRWSGRW